MGSDTRSQIAAVTAFVWVAALAGLSSLGCVSQATREQARLDQRKAHSHYELGVDHLQNGRTALGLRALLSAQELNPDNPRIHYALAVAYKRKGKIRDSERELGRVLELSSDFGDARLMLSNLFIHQGRFEEAIAEMQQLLDDPTFPGSWRALTNRGWAQFRLGRLGEARLDLEFALEQAGDYWPALLNLGILEAQEGHRLEAIALFDQMIELEPRSGAQAEANYRLAEIYVSIGQRQRAVAHLIAAVDQAASGPWGKKSEEYLRILR